MAIAYDSTWDSTGSTTTYEITLPGGADQVVVVYLRNDNTPTATVTVGAVSATQIVTQDDADSVGQVTLWVAKMGTTSGAVTITVADARVFHSAVYTGVDQTTAV